MSESPCAGKHTPEKIYIQLLAWLERVLCMTNNRKREFRSAGDLVERLQRNVDGMHVGEALRRKRR